MHNSFEKIKMFDINSFNVSTPLRYEMSKSSRTKRFVQCKNKIHNQRSNLKYYYNIVVKYKGRLEIIKLYLRSQFAVAISKEYNIKGRYEYNALKTYSLEF